MYTRAAVACNFSAIFYLRYDKFKTSIQILYSLFALFTYTLLISQLLMKLRYIYFDNLNFYMEKFLAVGELSISVSLLLVDIEQSFFHILLFSMHRRYKLSQLYLEAPILFDH